MLPHLALAASAMTTAVALAAPQANGTPVVSDVRAESLPAPAYVITSSPRFSWKLSRDVAGVMQSKYRIRIGQLHAWPGILAYDSGVVNSDNSTLVDIGSTTFSPGHTYLVSVQVWDEFDTPSMPTEPVQFTIAPDDSLWAQSTPVWDGTDNFNNYAFFRDWFTVPATARKITTYITANRSYRAHINGQYLGSGPARSDLNRAQLYNAFDLTDRFQVGAHSTNSLAIEAHYLGAVPGGAVSGWPIARWMTIIEDNQGTLTVLGSDPASPQLKVLADTPWNESVPIRGPEFGRASAVESYDAAEAAAVQGWEQPGFDDSSWSTANSVGVPDYTLRLQKVPISVETPGLSVSSVTHDAKSDNYIVDLGYLTTGWPTITVHNTQPGDVIRVHYSDRLDAQGRVLRGDGPNGITHNYDEFIALGATQETWEPHYWEAFQYFEVTGLRSPITTQDISVTQTHTPLDNPWEDGFDTSHELLNQIYEISHRTQICCVEGQFMDTPQRERKQYVADGFIQAMNVGYSYENPHVLEKLVRDVVTFSARFSGIIPAASPVDNPGFIAEWALHYPASVWKQYELYGDVRALEEHYTDLIAVVGVFEVHRDANNGLITAMPGFSDWPLSPINSGCPTRTPLNAMYYGTLRHLESIATVLGNAVDAQNFGIMADLLRTSINTHLFDGTDRYADCLGGTEFSQASSVFALYFDVVPDASQQAGLDYVTTLGFDVQTYGGYYLTDVLMRFGKHEFLMHEIEDQSRLWAKMIDRGASTTWEGWVPDGSLCHAFTAYPLKFCKQMAGLDPLAPAWARVHVDPKLASTIDATRAVIPTPRGTLDAETKIRADSWSLTITIPGNVIAEVHIPIYPQQQLLFNTDRLVDGTDVAELPPGIRNLTICTNEYLLEVCGGTFEFRAR